MFDATSNLTPPQQRVSELGLLESGYSVVLQMATGAGKTWLGERAISNALDAGHRAAYLAPTRALAQELYRRWCAQFGSDRVGVFTGDYGANRTEPPLPFERARLLVMTPERLDACTRAWRQHWRWLPELDWVVVDEIHLLGDGLRGARLEGTITRLRRLNPFVRLLGLSATLGNRAELADWLDGVDYGSSWRPVPLAWRVERYRRATDKIPLAISLVKETVQGGGKSIVFVQSRRRAETLAAALAETGLRVMHHHGGLDHATREHVENQFRERALDALVATPTLEVGLNMPARQVVLYDLQVFNGQEFVRLPVNSVWQRAGRAGRPGFDRQGEVVLLSPSWERTPGDYAKGAFEPVRSQLAGPAALAEQIIVELGSGLSRTRSELRTAFTETLAAQQQALPAIDAAVGSLITNAMATEASRAIDDERELRLRATPLGRVVIRHMLNPETVGSLRDLLLAPWPLTFFDLLLGLTSTADCEPIIPCDFEEVETLAERLRHERSHLLVDHDHRQRALASASGRRMLANLKMAALLRDWTLSGDLEAVSLRWSCYPFELRRLIDSTDRLALAAIDIARSTSARETHDSAFDPSANFDRLRLLVPMVRHGLDEDTASLTLVPGIGPKWAKRLLKVGVEDLEALAMATADDLADLKGLSSTRASQWIAGAEAIIKSDKSYLTKVLAPEITLAVDAPTMPSGVDPYRFRRALSLQVEAAGPVFRVSGGLDPHVVEIDQGALRCDCADHSKGNLCKHILAVRLHQGDPVLESMQRPAGCADRPLDLFDLWMR